MTASQWILYLLLTSTMVYCPGPMTLFMMANGIQLGYRNTLFAIFGGSSAYILQMIIVALGIGALLQTSPYMFAFLKYSGAIYLVYLGIKQWNASGIKILNQLTTTHSRLSLYMKGFSVGISNPKAILVFTVLFPQFINPHRNKAWQLIILGGTFLILQFISASVYASLGAKLYGWLNDKNKQTLQCKTFGFMLIIIGILLAMTKNS